jgi:hypothetical protein
MTMEDTPFDLEAYFAELADIPFQYHLRGTPRAGKTSLLSAMGDYEESRGGFTRRGGLLYSQSRLIRSHQAPASTQVLSNGNGQAHAPGDSVGAAAALAAPVAEWPAHPLDGETLQSYVDTRPVLGVAFPGDADGPPDSRNLVAYYRDTGRILVPVLHFARVHKEIARLAYPSMIVDLHSPAGDDADLRRTLKKAYSVTFQKDESDLLASGVDGLDEMLADERLKTAVPTLSRGRGVLRLRGPDLPSYLARRYVEIISGAAEHVVELELLYLQPYREALQAMYDPFCVTTHRDVAQVIPAVWGQPQLIAEVGKFMLGQRTELHSKNLLFVSSTSTKIRRQPSEGKSPVHVLARATEGAAEVLDVLHERLRRQPGWGRVSAHIPRATFAGYGARAEPHDTPAPAATNGAVPAPPRDGTPRAVAPTAIGREEDEGVAADVLRVAGYSALRLFPVLCLAALLVGLLAAGGAALGWEVLGWGTAALLAVALLAAYLRASYGSGSWAVRGNSVTLRKPLLQTVTADVSRLEFRSSWLERLLGVVQVRIRGNAVRAWPVFQAKRFLHCCGRGPGDVRLAPWADVALVLALAGVGTLALIRLWP